MEVVVRTAYGEAEVVVRAFDTGLTLLELVERVAGQPCPQVVLVDERSVVAGTPIANAGLLDGTVISTLEPAPVPAPASAALVPIAGPGVGTRTRLEAGQYRIGPGRRVNAAELDFAPVDEVAIGIEVHESGSTTITELGRPAWIGGTSVLPGTEWTSGLLEVDGRVFGLESGADPERTPSPGHSIGSDGTIRFNRPPRRRPEGDPGGSTSLADALSTVFGDHRRLWQRRASDDDAFRFAIGLTPDDGGDDGPRPLRTVGIDLTSTRGLGVIGDAGFVTNTVSALLLQAAIEFGPADLDIAVVAAPGRSHDWEWVKWLPHARPVDEPQLMTRGPELAAWLARRQQAWSATAQATAPEGRPDHLTLVVLDQLGGLDERAFPLRTLLGDPALPVRLVVLAGSIDEVPASCTTTVEERRGGGAVVESFDDGRRDEPVHTFVPSGHVVLDAARRLAGFSDPELTVDDAPLPRELSLERLLAVADADPGAIAARWFGTRHTASTAAPIGMAAEGPLDLALGRGALELLVIGSPGRGSDALVENLMLALAVDHQPDDLNMVLIELAGQATLHDCARLPHVADVVSDPSADMIQRVLRSLRAEVAHRQRAVHQAGARSYDEYVERRGTPHLPRLLLVLDEAAPSEAGRAEFVSSLLEVATDGHRYGVHLVAASERHRHLDRSIARAASRTVVLRLDDPPDDEHATLASIVLPRFVPRRAVLLDGGATMFQGVTSVGETLPRSSPLALEPFVVAREPSSIERRLTRMNSLAEHTDQVEDGQRNRLIDAIVEAARELDQLEQRSPCPPPLPEELTLREMLDRFPGDAVPFALEDLPDEQRQAPRWWQPGSDGGLALFASDRSERTGTVVALALGIAERAAPDDVHLYVVGDAADVADPTSLGGLERLPHTGAVVELDDGARLEALVHHLDEEITRRADLAERHGSIERVAMAQPSIAVLVDDLGRLRQRLRRRTDGDGILLDFERAIREGGRYGICVVLTATAPRYVPRALLGDLDQIVMRLDDAHELGVFGMRRSDFTVEARGRGIRPASSTEVQLAAPPEDVVAAVAELRLEPAQDRRPAPIAPRPVQRP